MNKALNVVGRILIFCVGEVSMYFAMMDPVVHTSCWAMTSTHHGS